MSPHRTSHAIRSMAFGVALLGVVVGVRRVVGGI